MELPVISSNLAARPWRKQKKTDDKEEEEEEESFL